MYLASLPFLEGEVLLLGFESGGLEMMLGDGMTAPWTTPTSRSNNTMIMMLQGVLQILEDGRRPSSRARGV